MTGFFTKQQTQSIVRPDGRHLSCNSCGLFKEANTPKMEPYGNFAKGIMCIGEAPGEIEDMRGKQWQDKSGVLFRKTLAGVGIDLFEDCINLNAINCKPDKDGKYRKPAPFEIDCCRRIVLGAIKKYKPKVIILLGTFAVQSVIGNRWKKDLGSIAKWTGFTIPDQDLQTWLCPVFSPAYVYKEDKVEVTNMWVRDLERAVQIRNEEFPVYKEPTIHYVNENRLDVLNNIQAEIVAIDYETTGLKPHAKEHKIVCMSIAVSEDEVYTFKMPRRKSLAQPVIDILENENIKKVGHNIKYEHTWSFNRLHGTVIKGWLFDTMLGAHLLDNRTGITGLKYQVYANFGVIDYSSEISPVLAAKNKKDSNSTNGLQKYVKTKENAMKTLKYCALDSANTLKLYLLQQKQIEELKIPF